MMLAYRGIFPEIFLLAMTCIVLLADLLFKSQYKNRIYNLSQITLLISLLMNLYLFKYPPPASQTVLFHHAFILDRLASVLKILILSAGILVFCLSRDYVKSKKLPFAEFYILSLFALLGMMLLASSYNFVMLFLALELSALPVYALTAIWRDSPNGAEAAMKYFVMGALASGMILYGLSFFYGATGSLDIITVQAGQPANNLLLIFALVFMLAGIAFKLGAAPFHLWVPDIYKGAPAAVTLFISAAPKIAALSMAFRLLLNALPALQSHWQPLLIVIAIASMSLGNIAAIMQTNLKSMLAYSSIAHMGYLSLGLIAGTNEGYGAALFYMLSYCLMAIGAFGLLVILSHEKEIENIQDLKGLNSRNPWLAFMFLLILFSMAGIPPTAGFFAKLTVLQALIGVHLVWLAVLALIFAVIGAYYYINVVKTLYFELPDGGEERPFYCAGVLKTVMTAVSLSVLLLGIAPGSVMTFCYSVF